MAASSTDPGLARAWYVRLPIIVTAAALSLPLIYLVWRAVAVDPTRASDLILRSKNLLLLGNTLALASAVFLCALLIAFPLAWISVRRSVGVRRLVLFMGVAPLAIPGYVHAYVLLGLTGDYGMIARTVGLSVPTINGFAGSVIALGAYTMPYLFLTLRASLLAVNTSLEESARTLGFGPRSVFARVTLRQVIPGVAAGAVLIFIHVFGDFGVVSLMRYETFSYAIYLQYVAAFDRAYAAVLALILLGLTILVLGGEALVLSRLSASRHRGALPRPGDRRKPGAGALTFVIAVFVLTVGTPVATLLYWSLGVRASAISSLTAALSGSLVASVSAAVITVAFALPAAYVASLRYRSPLRNVERLAYVAYAVPPLALALALSLFTLGTWAAAYQTLALLIVAYSIHFFAEAVAPLRASLLARSENLEEAARTLGRGPLSAFLSSSFPAVRRGASVAFIFVFISAMKELPITVLLAPAGFESLAVNLWQYANEAMFGTAAPFALAIVVISTSLAVLVANEKLPQVKASRSVYESTSAELTQPILSTG